MSADDSSPGTLGKRRRVDTEESDAPAEAYTSESLVKDERVWFDDGNIVVRAGPGIAGSDGLVYGFKCHRSVLADSSEVFKDMFRMPNPANVGTVDSVPFVDLHDKWEDVRDALRMLYGSV